MSSSAAPAAPPDAAGPAWLAASVPPLLYGLRLATAVCLALFIAFTLELDKPSWAGGSAAIVCQPILGSSLRKGFFRMIGTVVGATVAVVLTGIFPQNRAGFLVGMALWAAFCAFGGTLTRNFAAYAFALSGYTLAIIVGDSISSPDQVFHLAISRASEIIIGIVCATMVTGLSDLGQSPRRLAGTIDRLGREILFHFSELLWNPCDRLPEGPALRRDLIGRLAALDLSIDQAIGESPELRHRKAILWAAMSGLFAALSGWRIAESHLVVIPAADARREARAVAELLPDAWHETAAPGSDAAAPGTDRLSDLQTDRREDLAAARALADLNAGGVSQRLLADAAARVALGLTAAANGLALLREPAQAREPSHRPGLVVADVLPALVNAMRTFASICAAILFWILTQWPSGLGALTFMVVTVLLLAPQQEKSGPAALGFGIGTIIAACLAAVVNFALLPNHEGFLSLTFVMSAVLVPLAALSTVPALAPYLVAAAMNFVPLLGPTNEITFNTLTFYNSALGIVGGCVAGAVALVIIPPVPRAVRADRLVSLTLRDLRRMADGRWTPTPDAWQNRVYTRLVAMPDGVDPVCGSRLVAALSMGLQVLRLRSLGTRDQFGPEIEASLRRLAASDVDAMMAGLDRVDAQASDRASELEGNLDLRIRTAIQVVRDVVRQHRHEFGSERP